MADDITALHANKQNVDNHSYHYSYHSRCEWAVKKNCQVKGSLGTQNGLEPKITANPPFGTFIFMSVV